jgi:hypothetical protein
MSGIQEIQRRNEKVWPGQMIAPAWVAHVIPVPDSFHAAGPVSGRACAIVQFCA